MAVVDECLAVNGEGVEYREFSCMYPQLEPFYFEFEKKYDPYPVHNWMVHHSSVPIIAVTLYGFLIFYGRIYMKDREPWNWRTTMKVWNWSLSLFSFIGLSRTLPQLVHNLATLSVRDNLCADPRATYGSGSCGLWVQLFILSKFPELLDTFFIVIHKKPLIFLHWYHHISVLLYCWHAYSTASPPGIFFVTMNYAVHSLMYWWYGSRPKWVNPIVVTAAQISQMIVGVGVTLAGFYFYITDSTCMIQRQNNTAAFIMYGSYLFLFLQFFIGRYYKGQVKVTPKKKRV